ncbi:hypothetical protein E2C01_043097 [Portunus trituberculatus]|uniref:Uncharacterized protein n=1 Tax=Portunus trituberculatus TaxID=210409 RepID=A0A5B7FVE9_PORTR|nr:hypothetical protein [Portunus trituberculatus]
MRPRSGATLDGDWRFLPLCDPETWGRGSSMANPGSDHKSGNFSTALLDEAALVKYGEIKRLIQAAPMNSLVQHLKVSLEAILIRGFVVRKSLVMCPLISLVLSK